MLFNSNGSQANGTSSNGSRSGLGFNLPLSDDVLREISLAQILNEPRELFVLWAIGTQFCISVEAFRANYKPDWPLEALLDVLDQRGFLLRDADDVLSLTELGRRAVEHIGPVNVADFARLAAPLPGVADRFAGQEPAQFVAPNAQLPEKAQGGALPDEWTLVERPFLEQLRAMGWKFQAGDSDVPEFSERAGFGEVVLKARLRAKMREINLDDQEQPWLDDERIEAAMNALDNIEGVGLVERNENALKRLYEGFLVNGDPNHVQAPSVTVDYIDWANPENNEFLALNQFRVDVRGTRRSIRPDIVLFVNGIPLVVIECKNPANAEPMAAAIEQLRRYAELRTPQERSSEDNEREGNDKLFEFNAFVIATHGFEARAAGVSAPARFWATWKRVSPSLPSQVCAELGLPPDAPLSSQQTLVAGMLRPSHLLHIARSYIVFTREEGRVSKIVARYQQFEAVEAAVERLLHAPQRALDALHDGRGGLIWHTQGSGKSLTMVFLVRRMRRTPSLRSWKVVIVTDRIDLEDQMQKTAGLAGESFRPASYDIQGLESNTERVLRILAEQGPDIVFATIQKYQEEGSPTLSLVNSSPKIVLLVDEAHRTQGGTLHASMQAALPHAAKIGFTGTPLLIGEKKKTEEIFGSFLSRYSIRQAERDGATVPILYEGRTTEAALVDGETLDRRLFEDVYPTLSTEQLERLNRKYGAEGEVLEARALIEAKASDMFAHYVSHILPNGLKAQVVANSQRAADRYVSALRGARDAWLLRQNEFLVAHPNAQEWLEPQIEALPSKEQELIRSLPRRVLIAQLDFAAVLSQSEVNADLSNSPWANRANINRNIERFTKPLPLDNDTPDADPLAFLCVMGMLITGFDAPVEGVLYLDRRLRDPVLLLQTVARVNRPYPSKSHGLVVDYVGISRHLRAALDVYASEDIQGALERVEDQLPTLVDRHRRVLALFEGNGVSDINDTTKAIALLAKTELRADFGLKLRAFLESLDIVLPRANALPYVPDARRLGFLQRIAANVYRDSSAPLSGLGRKVRELIDRHIVAQGVSPTGPPVSILAPDFEVQTGRYDSPRTQASAMEHALRHHIRDTQSQDPSFYRRLSERLEEVLRRLQEQPEQLVIALRELIAEARKGRFERGQDTGVGAILDVLLDERARKLDIKAGDVPQTERKRLEEFSRQLLRMLATQTHGHDFWRFETRRDDLRKGLFQLLDEPLFSGETFVYDRLESIAGELMDIARARYVPWSQMPPSAFGTAPAPQPQ